MTKDNEAIYTGILDCHGRRIKLGDRIRIIADACNKFMHDWYEEDWIPEMHFDKDYFGTAKQTENGRWIVEDESRAEWWDLDLIGKEPYQDNRLEIV